MITKTTDDSLSVILKYLPEHISKKLAFPDEMRFRHEDIMEIRLRVGSEPAVTTCKGNISLSNIKITAEDIKICINNFCENSYHTQAENIYNGFIMTKEGIRTGICGESISDKIVKITSLNIRVPRFIEIKSSPVYNLIKQEGIKSMLIYSPPAHGKTTFIRNLAHALSNGLYGLKKYRVALIDEKKEIYNKNKMTGGYLDIFYGYNKTHGFESAVKTMNPEVIICDEIGTHKELNAILETQNSGVPLIATTHTDSLEKLYYKPSIKTLITNRIFDYAVGLQLANYSSTAELIYDIGKLT